RVLVDVHRGTIADPDEDDLVLLKDRIGLEAHLAPQSAISLREDLDECAITPVIGEAVKPAGQSVWRIALWTRREGHPTMQTAVCDTVDCTINTLEKEALPQDGFRTCLALR